MSCPYLQQVVGWEPIRGTDLTRPKKSTTEMTEQHHILFVKATQSTKLQNKKTGTQSFLALRSWWYRVTWWHAACTENRPSSVFGSLVFCVATRMDHVVNGWLGSETWLESFSTFTDLPQKTQRSTTKPSDQQKTQPSTHRLGINVAVPL